jgi:hypothetical protein
MGAERFQADLIALSGDEAQRERDEVVAAEPQFARSIDTASPRLIPVFTIESADPRRAPASGLCLPFVPGLNVPESNLEFGR